MSTGIIYCARNIHNGKMYIGQTIRKLNSRIKQHKYDRKKLNFLFYRAINKYGWDSFIWGIVEECDCKDLIFREKYWIEYYDTYNNGYNSTLGGEGTVNPKRFKTFTIKSPNGEIITSSNIRQFCRDNQLTFSNFYNVIIGKIKSHKGWSLPSTERLGHFDRIEKQAKKFTLLNPSGNITTGKNIREFCRENSLDQSAIGKVISGKQKSHKGWTLP